LVNILESIDTGQNLDELREKHHLQLASVTPLQIALAQQQLIENGKEYAEIAELCPKHISLAGQPARKLREQLPADHVIRKLFVEHEMAKCLLADLRRLNEKIADLEFITPVSREYKKLLHVAGHLLASEKHVDAEEEIIFPVVEQAGIYAIPRLLRAEHFELRHHAEQIAHLVFNAATTDFGQFRSKLDEIAALLVPLKHFHIFKEENLFYPIVVELVKDDRIWVELDDRCEHTGYCCF